MTLREVINRIEHISNDFVIFATKTDDAWNLDAPAALVWLSDMETIGTDLEELDYFLEIGLAKDVLDVWKQWRGGRFPTEEEIGDALIYYADNDAYLETEDT